MPEPETRSVAEGSRRRAERRRRGPAVARGNGARDHGGPGGGRVVEVAVVLCAAIVLGAAPAPGGVAGSVRAEVAGGADGAGGAVPWSADAAAHGDAAEGGAGSDRGSSAAATWRWPVEPHPVTAPFVAPADRYSAGHRGVDLGAPAGASVVAVADGTVFFAGRVVDRSVVTLDLGGGVLASVEPVEPSVTTGQGVRAGDPIGVVGSGGHCSGGCLHLGARIDGEYVSPLRFLGGIPRAVLLPTR